MVAAESQRKLLDRFTTIQFGNGVGLLTTRTQRPVLRALVSRSRWWMTARTANFRKREFAGPGWLQ